MAKIRMSALVSDVKGRIGSQVFSSWKGRPYVKSMPTTVRNPVSKRQGFVRASLANSATNWNLLSPENRLIWRQYAKEISSTSIYDIGTTNIVPKKGNLMSGFNAYTAINTRLINTKLPPVILPPSSTPPTVLEATVANVFGHIVIFGQTGVNARKDDVVRVFQKGDYPKAIANMGTHVTITASDLQVDGSAKFQAILDTQTIGGEYDIGNIDNAVYMGSTISIQMNLLRPNGALSSPSTSFEILLWDNVSDEHFKWMRTLWDSCSDKYKTDLATLTTMYGLGAPDYMNTLAAASYIFTKFIRNYIAGEPTMDFFIENGYTKSALETAGIPMTVSEIVSAGLLPHPLIGSTDSFTNEW